MHQDRRGYVGAPLPPTVRRRDFAGWILASCLAGVPVGALVLSLLWRPLPGSSLPVGALLEHASYWAKIVMGCLLPSWFQNDRSFYASVWASYGFAERVGIAARLCLAAMASSLPAIVLANFYLTPRDALIVVRGSRRYEGGFAVKALRRRHLSGGHKDPDHPIAPNVPWSTELWTRHVLIVGGVGSGKSTVLRPLVTQIVDADEQLLMFDPKSEFTSGFKRPKIIAPWDRRSLAWDIAKDLRNIQDMRQFAVAMIRDSHDPMWSNASRQLLVGLLVYLQATHRDDWGWAELARLICLDQPELLAIMQTHNPVAVRAVEKASVTTAGILINLASFCSSILDLAVAWGDVPSERRLSMVEWSQGHSPHRQIILQGHGAYSELTKSYAEGMLGVLSAMVNSVEMSDDANRKIWFVADEFPQMGKVPVRALFEVGRSRGVRCVIACQDFAQIEEVHGEKMMQAIASMCGTLIVGKMMPGRTAKEICELMGVRELERPSVSVSTVSGGGAGAGKGGTTSYSYSREQIPLYLPSELSSRLGLNRAKTAVKLLLFTDGNAYELMWPLVMLTKVRRGNVPAPWTRGVASVVRSRLEIEKPKAGVVTGNPAREMPDVRKEDDPTGAAQLVALLAAEKAHISSARSEKEVAS